jgi:hypothetical protein
MQLQTISLQIYIYFAGYNSIAKKHICLGCLLGNIWLKGPLQLAINEWPVTIANTFPFWKNTRPI